MSDIPTDPAPQGGIDFGLLAHTIAGISAMVPVTGVILGFMGWLWSYTLAYVTLWIAFIHLVIRGVQSLRAGDAPGAET